MGAPMREAMSIAGKLLVALLTGLILWAGALAWGQITDNKNDAKKARKEAQAASRIGRINNVFLEEIAKELKVTVSAEKLRKAAEDGGGD